MWLRGYKASGYYIGHEGKPGDMWLHGYMHVVIIQGMRENQPIYGLHSYQACGYCVGKGENKAMCGYVVIMQVITTTCFTPEFEVTRHEFSLYIDVL